MNSAKTQIHRRNTTAPTRWLLEHVDFSSYRTMLHFGEGWAFPDTSAFEERGLSVWAFDPNSPDEWKRDRVIINPNAGLYDVGVSNYVFNTLLPSERKSAFDAMMGCCERCIIAVRTDKVNGSPVLGYDGVTTSRDTFQTQLSADAWVEWFERMSPDRTSVEVLHKTSTYVILGIKRK